MQFASFLWIDTENIGLTVDMDDLSMTTASYLRGEHEEWTVMEFTLSHLPQGKNFVVFAGLEPILHYLRALNFESEQVRGYLKAIPYFNRVPDAFFETYLQNFKFTGDVYGVAEGTVIFPGTPVLTLQGPRGQLQLLGSYLSSILSSQTLCATQAARYRLAVGSQRVLIEVGSRWANCPQAAVNGGRAAYIGGMNGTTNLLASFFNPEVPPMGTLPHQKGYSAGNSLEFFRQALKTLPHSTFQVTLENGDQNSVSQILDMMAECVRLGEVDVEELPGIHLEGNNLYEQTLQVRALMQDKGISKTKIILGGDLDELRIAQLEAQFKEYEVRTGQALGEIQYTVGKQGIHARSSVEDACLFRLAMTARPSVPLKQVYRFYTESGHWQFDRLTLLKEPPPPGGFPLLIPVMSRGTPIVMHENLEQVRARTWTGVQTLPEELLHWTPQPKGYFDQRFEVSNAVLEVEMPEAESLSGVLMS